MTDKEAMKLALFALDIVKIQYTQSRHINEAITALKDRLADPMRGVQRLGQEIEQEQLISDQINYGMSVTQGGKRIDPMSIYKEPEQEPVAFPRQAGDSTWIIDTAFIWRVKHTIEPNTPYDWTPSEEQIETVLLSLEKIPSSLYTTPPQRTEQNFCSRCGKRTPDLITIHTCTPPKENT